MKEFYKPANKVLMIKQIILWSDNKGKASKVRKRSLRIVTLWRRQSPTLQRNIQET